ncbi:MAG: uroporphyrinogen decarboxylase family protein [Methanosphaera sp.]|nr:uroporphyrinogen decarboxylase family protein [Methanosphaera sp.]
MDIKENLINALHGKECEKTPVTAFPSVFTTELLQKAHTTFDEANHNPEKMAEVATSLYEYTGLEGITIPLDLWFESESLGHFFEREEGSLKPVIMKSPFETPEDVEIPSDFINTGQFPIIEKAAEIIHEKYDDKNVPIIGEVTGAFSFLTDLVDLGTIIKMLNSDYFEIDDALEEINNSLMEEIDFYQEIGVDCIVVNDPSSTARILKPKLFEDLVEPYLIELSDYMDVPGVLHICGDTNSNLEHMLSCGYEGLSISQEVDISYARQIKETIASDSVICGNLDIGETLLMKNADGVREDSMKCLEKKVDILGPGCNIAYETPLNNIKAMVETRNEYFDKRA